MDPGKSWSRYYRRHSVSGNGAIYLRGEKEARVYSEKLFCGPCGLGYELLDPRLFSFNSRQGACPECAGLGARWEFDPALVVPEKNKSLQDGALFPLPATEFPPDQADCCVNSRNMAFLWRDRLANSILSSDDSCSGRRWQSLRGAFTILNDAITGSEGEEADLIPAISDRSAMSLVPRGTA